ncbi:hypothetical protein [Pseudomonas sp. CGJS7]|uniref:hypothetical protein n=1 Tax=Pseudomonas sp. CGJS7 TaxID=3109348 RepID=UPI00300B4D37
MPAVYWRVVRADFPDDQVLLACFAFFTLLCVGQLVSSWHLADSVDDLGDRLLVRRRGVEISIALNDIERVSKQWFKNPDHIALQLRRPTVFGSRIVFVAAMSPWHGFGENEILVDLRRRIGRAGGWRPTSG